jgi:hypothetical protein
MPSVLIATDDFVHLKSRFAAVDGRGSQQGRKSQAAAGDRMCLAPTDLSLTPRFSEVHGRVCYPNALAVYSFIDKTAEAVGSLSCVVNIQLKQGVNERSVGAKPMRSPAAAWLFRPC